MTVYSNGQETTGFVDSSSEYFNLINAARIKEIPIMDEYNTDMYSQDMDKQFIKNYFRRITKLQRSISSWWILQT